MKREEYKDKVIFGFVISRSLVRIRHPAPPPPPQRYKTLKKNKQKYSGKLNNLPSIYALVRLGLRKKESENCTDEIC